MFGTTLKSTVLKCGFVPWYCGLAVSWYSEPRLTVLRSYGPVPAECDPNHFDAWSSPTVFFFTAVGLVMSGPYGDAR